MRQLIRSRLLHFTIVGFVLYVVNGHFERQNQRVLTCLTPSQRAVLTADWAQVVGRAPTANELSQLVNVALDEQMLVSEAMLQGLHKSDQVIIQRLLRDADFLGIKGDSQDKIDAVLATGVAAGDEVVRRRLIQLMQHASALNLSGLAPSKDELDTIYSQRPDLGVVPLRLSFEHVFFDSSHSNARARAEQILRENTQDSVRGDVFLDGNHFSNLNRVAITSKFGEDFSLALASSAKPIGSWFGPLQSAYGFHLVRIKNRNEAYRLSFDELAPELEEIWRRERQAQAWNAYVEELRDNYKADCHAAI
ncbi:peptidyl-prolyl cis-trans isomerase [Zhongshania aquimaris]|uniref:peptidylprolyl isomerase n=1 Tax=Zhongshania aquimaris TaxID=2857107 RepID=A0ABS6VM67_9GAMM|nr:peptidylprolyl isomerase [Zhongshania aquimaris]MBW2939408.1 peptidyl-prolyl cis-trans isomerase [Zhongshania aquimaris]